MTVLARPTWMLVLGLAWAGALAACGGGGAGGGGGGGTGPCRPESDAQLCEAAAAECGSATATDRCGEVRVLDCGGCEEPLWCGGGGEPNRCGATCPAGCPDGWTCEQGACAGGDRARIPLAFATVRVGGKILLEGAAPPAAPDCYDYSARVSFRETVTGASSTALVPCEAADYAFEAELAPGTYRVSAGPYRTGDSTLPEGDFVVEPALVVEGPRSDLMLDIRTVSVAGRITRNGVAPVAALDCYDFTTRVMLVETTTGTTGQSLIPCDDPDFSFEVRVPPGTYQVWVSKYRDEDSDLPGGAFAVSSDLRVEGSVSGLVFDLATVEVAGRLLWKGEVPEASPGCYDYTTYIGFEETSGKAFATALVPCEALDFGFRGALPPGTYAVYVSKYRSEDSNLPDGTFVVDRALRIDGPAEEIVFDLRTVRASGTVRWNGVTPRVSSGCTDYSTVVRFTGLDGSSAQALIPCESAEFAFDLAILPGAYEVSLWKFRPEDSDLPDGTFVVARELPLDGFTGPLALELTTVPVAGTVTVNGRAPTIAEDCYDYTAMVHFREWRARPEEAVAVTSVTTRVPCSATDFAWEAQVPPGDYRIGISPYRPHASSLPSGSFVPVGRLEIR